MEVELAFVDEKTYEETWAANLDLNSQSDNVEIVKLVLVRTQIYHEITECGALHTDQILLH